jgi:hypothetical protein
MEPDTEYQAATCKAAKTLAANGSTHLTSVSMAVGQQHSVMHRSISLLLNLQVPPSLLPHE